MRKATSSWAGLSLAPAPAKYNATVTVSGTLSSETGTLPGRAGLVVLQTSTNNSTWTTSTAAITENPPSTYSAPLKVVDPPRYFRFAYAGELNYAPGAASGVRVNYAPNSLVVFTTPTVSTSTPLYSTSFTVGASLSGETGPAVGRTGVVVQTWYGNVPLDIYGVPNVPAAEDSPGHYSATFGVPLTPEMAGGQLRYKFIWPGDAQYSGSAPSAFSPYVTGRAATIGFQNVSAAPTIVSYGGTSTVSVDLASETGASVRSVDASVGVVQSSDNAVWSVCATGVVDSVTAGHYSATVPSITAHRYYRFVVSTRNPTRYVVPSANTTSAAVEVTLSVVPAVPTGLVASDTPSDSGGSIQVRWNANGDPDLAGYRLYRSQAPSGPWVTVGPSASSPFTDTGLDVNQKYYYALSAYDADGNESSMCVPASATASENVAPGATALPTVLPGSHYAALAWPPSSDNLQVTAYEIWSHEGTAGTTYAKAGESSSTAFSRTDLSNGVTSWFKVRARDAAGNVGAFSDEVSVVPRANDASGGVTTRVQDSFYPWEWMKSPVVYGGLWTRDYVGNSYSSFYMYSSQVGASATLTFSGTAVKYYGWKRFDRGMTDVYIDGILQARVDGYAAVWQTESLLWSSGTLPNGLHTITIVNTGSRNASNTTDYITDLDYFSITEP
jgi:hypothetical protein